MTGLFFTLLAAFMAGIGARDQMTMAGLSSAHGARPALLLVALAISAASAALAAWGGTLVAPVMEPAARSIFAATAFLFAGAEMLVLRARKVPKEPTQSLSAFAFVLFSQQLTDGSRFLVMALGVLLSAPLTAGAGGAVAGGLLMTLGWSAPELAGHDRLQAMRRLIGLGLIGVAVWLALSGLNLI